MSFKISGRLHHEICDKHQSPIPRGMLKVYAARNQQTSDEFRLLSQGEVAKYERNLLGTGKIESNGNYSVILNKTYKGGNLEVHLVMTAPAERKTPGASEKTEQVFLANIAPKWTDEKVPQAIFEYVLSKSRWCDFLERIGWWVLCGKVLDPNCKNPVPGVLVKAFDRDFIQDDGIGEGITDGFGRFCIYYQDADFRPTTVANVQHEWGNAPDLYFKVESQGSGFVLLDEPRSRGNEKDRCNVPRCFCVTLCVERLDPNSPCKVIFDRVGRYEIDPDSTLGMRIDSNTGLAVDPAGNLAFTGTVDFKGKLPEAGSPEQYEYRFLYRNLTTAGPETPIAGNMIPNGCRIGKRSAFVVRNTVRGPITIEITLAHVYLTGNTTSANPDVIPVAADGWIQAPNSADFSSFEDRLLCFDTEKVHFPQIDLNVPNVYQAGDPPISDARFQQAPSHKFEIIMESRRVGSNVICRTILDKITINNSRYDYTRHPYWPGTSGVLNQRRSLAMLDICELNPADPACNATSGCDKIRDKFTIKYTAFHPHLRSAKLKLVGPGATFEQDVLANPSGSVVCQDKLEKCSYVLWLRTYLNLTVGYGLLDTAQDDYIGFCAMG